MIGAGRSNDVGKAPLDLLEIGNAGEEQNEGNAEGDGKGNEVEWLAEERGAEALNYAGHRIEVEQPAPTGRDQTCWIDHGRGEHPKLDHEGITCSLAMARIMRRRLAANALS